MDYQQWSLIIEAIRWKLSFMRNATLHQWMKEQYSRSELERLVEEAIDADLCHVYNPLARDVYLDGGLALLRETVARLYRRYGDQIWAACYRAAARGRPTNGYDLYPSWLAAFGTLEMAYQVIAPAMFEEFLVRHALSQCAKEIIQEEPRPASDLRSSPREKQSARPRAKLSVVVERAQTWTLKRCARRPCELRRSEFNRRTTERRAQWAVPQPARTRRHPECEGD